MKRFVAILVVQFIFYLNIQMKTNISKTFLRKPPSDTCSLPREAIILFTRNRHPRRQSMTHCVHSNQSTIYSIEACTRSEHLVLTPDIFSSDPLEVIVIVRRNGHQPTDLTVRKMPSPKPKQSFARTRTNGKLRRTNSQVNQPVSAAQRSAKKRKLQIDFN